MSRTPITTRLPFAALQERCGMNRSEMARSIGVDRNTLHRAATIGLSHDMADRYAIALGYHPLEIWPDFHDDIKVGAA